MRIAVFSIGSRGDVQPYLALARGLRHVGHDVLLAGPPNFAPLAHTYQVPFAAVGPDWRSYLQKLGFHRIVDTGSWLRELPLLARAAHLAIEQVLHETWSALQNAEALVAASGVPIAASFAERRGIPYIEAAMQPLTPTTAFPSAAVSMRLRLGPHGNVLSHCFLEQVLWQIYRTHINRFRRQVLQLAPYPFLGPMDALRRAGTPRLYAFSPLVVAPPPDWSATTVITGYWFLPTAPDWSPSPQLRTFLDAGPAPIYMGFGSMFGGDPAATLALMLQALELSGQRAVLAQGWGGIEGAGRLPEHVLMIDEAPHDWLFPQMAALVHHGGAGTTGAGLRSGVPSIVVPHVFDQAFWASRVAALGVGPAPLPRPQLTAERLAEAICQAIEQAALRTRAQAVGSQIRAERGVANAIDSIHRALQL
jgi:sterol 3beta-glucosyltransferase